MNYFNIIVSQISLYLYCIYKYIASSEAWAYEVGCNKHLNKILLLLKKKKKKKKSKIATLGTDSAIPGFILQK